MVQHNEHHAAELDQMADNLEKMDLLDAAKTIRDGVADFQKALSENRTEARYLRTSAGLMWMRTL